MTASISLPFDLCRVAALGACVAFGLSAAHASDESLSDRKTQERILRAHIRFLADDLLEGRAPGSRGDLLAQRYIASQLEALGLEPGAPGGGWLQKVPLVGVNARVPPEAVFRKGSESLSIRYKEDFIAASGVPRPQTGFREAEVVFAGYGMVAPEFRWDDFKGADVRGKVLLVMNNDLSSSPDHFAGETRLYYGRWDYKYEEAARKGAVAAIIIHTTQSAGYPWQVVQTSWTGEQFDLRGEGGPSLEVQAWATEESARRIAMLGGFDLDELRRRAESRDFRPVPLGITLSLSLENRLREVDSANVLGVLKGSDDRLAREVVVYTAHHDHLGMAEEAKPGTDRVYNGAVDNASGVAALLLLAERFARLPVRPGRSVLFAAVGAEEQGLLGSLHLARNPPVPAGFIAANLNIDGINILGRTRDVTAVGLGKSSLDDLIRKAAAAQGREVKPDQFPDRGFYYRSDQFSFARIGVPGVYLDSGLDFIGRPQGWGKAKLEEWEKTHYHQVTDEYRDDWDLSGALEDIEVLFEVGRGASSGDLPSWKPGDEFEAARKAAIKERG